MGGMRWSRKTLLCNALGFSSGSSATKRENRSCVSRKLALGKRSEGETVASKTHKCRRMPPSVMQKVRALQPRVQRMGYCHSTRRDCASTQIVTIVDSRAVRPSSLQLAWPSRRRSADPSNGQSTCLQGAEINASIACCFVGRICRDLCRWFRSVHLNVNGKIFKDFMSTKFLRIFIVVQAAFRIFIYSPR